VGSVLDVLELVRIYYRLMVNLDSIAEFCGKNYTTTYKLGLVNVVVQ
jgi:hypothetical protein